MKRIYKPLPPLDVVRNYFSYSIVTGKMYYLIQPNNKTKVGDEAGNTHHTDRVYVSINGERYARGRVAWYIITGEDAGEVVVEHKDRDKGNDAWHNLRLENNSNNGVNSDYNQFRPNKLNHKFIYKKVNKGITYYQVKFRRKDTRLQSPNFHTLEEAIDWKQRNITPLLDDEGFLL